MRPTIFDPSHPPARQPNPAAAPTIRVCPDCAGPIAHQGSCLSCVQCGWGRCA